MQQLAGSCFQIRFAHGSVGSAEVYCLRLNLFDAAAGTDRLIVDVNVRVKLAVFADPLFVKRVGKRRARALQRDRPAAVTRALTSKSQKNKRGKQYDGGCSG